MKSSLDYTVKLILHCAGPSLMRAACLIVFMAVVPTLNGVSAELQLLPSSFRMQGPEATQRVIVERFAGNIARGVADDYQLNPVDPSIAIVEEGDTRVAELADDVVTVPSVDEFLQPFVSIIPLQLLSYHIALLRGCDVDKPRNLAKSVTVE